MADRPRFAGLRTLARLLLGHLPAYRNARLQDLATQVLRDDSGRDAWVVTVVNGSLSARQRLRLLFRLLPRTAWSRLRFRPAAAVPAVRLSLLCPSRGRVRSVAAFLASLQRTAARPDRVEALFYVDADDPDLDRYRRLFARAPARWPRLGACVLLVGDPVGVPAAWNALAEAATGDLLLMANDDQLYVDYGWDVRLDERFGAPAGSGPDRVCCLYFDAGQYPDGAADFPIVSRGWYGTLGYFVPTIFQQWEVERWVFDLARRIDRLIAVPGVLVEHRHYQDYRAPFDATYQRHRLTRQKSFSDHALFLRTADQRATDAAALLRTIAASPPDAPRPVVDADGYWFAGYLREHHPKIRAEVDAAGLGAEPAALFDRGRRNQTACATYPVTTGIVGAIPEATTLGPGTVSLERLRAGDRARPAAAAVTVHLGVRVPDGAAYRVRGQDVSCPEGGCMVLAADAELTNPGGADWIVLTLDVPADDRVDSPQWT